MASQGSVLQRIGHYSLAKIAVMAAGLVSYPILTRVLTPAEYGMMGLILTMLNLAIGVSKLGLQFSTLRLWSQYDDNLEGQQRFILSFFLATAGASLAVLLLYDLGNLVLRPLLGDEVVFFVLLSSPLILSRSLGSFGMAQLNASQRSRAYAIFEVTQSYLSMAGAVLGAAVIIGGLRGYYMGLVLGEGLVILGLMAYVLRGRLFARRNLDLRLVGEAVRFGLPMAVYELSGVLFYTGDRFIILWLADHARLGFYTVAFNLTSYVNTLFAIPVMMTVTPAVTAIFEKEGAPAAARFLGQASRWFFLFSAAAIVGAAFVAEDLVRLLASETYLPGAALVPVLLAGFLGAGLREILGAGLFLKKKPWLMARLNLLGAALNAALNLALIPPLGIQGAAVATLISQLCITVLCWQLGSRLVPVPIDVRAALLHMGCAACMGAALAAIDPGSGLLRLAMRLVVGALLYTVLLNLVDTEARAMTRRVMNRILRRS